MMAVKYASTHQWPWNVFSKTCMPPSVALSGPTLWPNGLGRQASVHRITQARILGWVAISSLKFSWFRDQVHFCVLSGHLKKIVEWNRKLAIWRAAWFRMWKREGQLVPSLDVFYVEWFWLQFWCKWTRRRNPYGNLKVMWYFVI